MTNWQTFEIKFKKNKEARINRHSERQPSIFFGLDNYVRYENDNNNAIYCADVAPFTDFEEGDYLEIDLDKTAMKRRIDIFDDFSIVRKISSSTNVISSRGSSQQLTIKQFQELGDQVMNRAEQSGGQMEAEFIARQEYRTDGTISAQQASWVYRHKK